MADILFKTDDYVFSYRVGGLLIYNGKVLMQNAEGDDGYAFIGGHVAFGETTDETLVREFKEEIGADIKIERLLMVNENFFPWGNKPCQQINLYYLISLKDETQIPLDRKFKALDELGNERIELDMCWIPLENVRAKYLVEHYGFDPDKIYIIRRCTFPSDASIDAKISEINSLTLKMVRSPETFSGIHFTDPKVGEIFDFTHPVHGTEHTLTVVEYEAEEMDQSKFASDEFIFPTHMTAMQYTVTPDLPREEVSVRECGNGDSPRRKETAPKPGCDFCSAIGIIRSADGPTAVVVGTPQEAKVHSACSGLYFEKQESVEWRMSFRVKMVDDAEIRLI